MPALHCKCGRWISYGEIPCKDEWVFMSDVEYDAFSGKVDAEDVYRSMKSFLKCPDCSRLWFFWDGYQNAPQEFLPGSMAADALGS
jgi:hypothetical protein